MTSPISAARTSRCPRPPRRTACWTWCCSPGRTRRRSSRRRLLRAVARWGLVLLPLRAPLRLPLPCCAAQALLPLRCRGRSCSWLDRRLPPVWAQARTKGFAEIPACLPYLQQLQRSLNQLSARLAVAKPMQSQHALSLEETKNLTATAAALLMTSSSSSAAASAAARKASAAVALAFGNVAKLVGSSPT